MFTKYWHQQIHYCIVSVALLLLFNITMLLNCLNLYINCLDQWNGGVQTLSKQFCKIFSRLVAGFFFSFLFFFTFPGAQYCQEKKVPTGTFSDPFHILQKVLYLWTKIIWPVWNLDWFILSGASLFCFQYVDFFLKCWYHHHKDN